VTFRPARLGHDDLAGVEALPLPTTLLILVATELNATIE